MSKHQSEQFRAQAKECRLRAEKAFSRGDKESWLRAAAEWIKLAEEEDERDRRDR
jgi:hypothetical protein